MAVTKTKKSSGGGNISYWSKPILEGERPKRIDVSYVELTKSDGKVTFKTADGKTFQLPEDRVITQIKESAPKAEKPSKVTATKKNKPEKTKRAKLKTRLNTTRGMTPAQLAFDSGNALQRDIFRALKKRTQGWSTLPIDEKVRLNIAEIKSSKVPRDLIPGVIDQMVRQHIVTERVAGSRQGVAAISAITSAFGSLVEGGVKPIISRSLNIRKQFGKSNEYDAEGKLVKSSGGNRRVRITKGRGKTGRARVPVAKPKKGEKQISDVRGRTEERRKIFDPRAEQQAKFVQGLEREVQEEQKTVVIGEEVDAKGKTKLVTAKVGGGKTQTKGLGKLSEIGKTQNFERDVEIAQRYITDALKTRNITKSGYVGLLAEQPHFKGMDSRELAKIAGKVKIVRRKQKVDRKIRRAAGKPKVSGGNRKYNVLGEDITGTQRPKATKKQIDTARKKSKAKETRSAERRAAALRGEVPAPVQKPKAATVKQARRLEAEVEGGVTKAEPVFKKPTVKSLVKEGAAAGKVRVTKARPSKPAVSGKLTKIENLQLAALKAAGSKTNARLLAKSLKPTKNVVKLAKAGGIMGLATSFGANYILSQLEEKKKGRR